MPADFKFIHVDIKEETLVERHLKRSTRMCEDSGITMDQMWAMDGYGMPEAREKYG